MNKQLFNGYYCRKCNSIPLIEILPSNNNISIFFFCTCGKKYQSLDLFNNNYYQKNIEINKISSIKNKDEYFIKSSNNKLEKENQINNIIDKYYKTKNEFHYYSKELKDNLINDLKLKIKKINDAYENFILINKKIENIYEILIESYKIIDDNISNINNIINNSNFNKKPIFLNRSFETVFSFYEKEFIIKQPEQIKNEKIFYNHKGVNCFLDYKINNNQYYGVSSSYDSSIDLFDLTKNKHLFTFQGDKIRINWITLSSNNNIISCGNDYFIKIWPLIDNNKIIEFNKFISKEKEINLSPLYLYKCEIIIQKIEYLINKDKTVNYDYLLGSSNYSIYLFKYIKDNFPNNNNNIDLISKYSNERIYNFIVLKSNINNNPYNNFICGFNEYIIFLLNFPKLKIINENDKLKISLISMNNCVQINDNELLFIQYKLLTIFNIIKFQKTLSIKMDNVVDCITILRDNTIIQGGIDGIKRYLKYNFKELPILKDGYSNDENYYEVGYVNDTELECILCIKELLDGRIVFCYENEGINISKLNIF